MPELPEVEHERRRLAKWLRGTTIVAARVLDARILDPDQNVAAVRKLAGRAVRDVDRKGKWLRVRFDRGFFFSHLGMTGRWSAEENVRSAKVELDIARGSARRTLVYSDPRLFGRFVVANADIAEWTALGPDPLHDGIDPAALTLRLARRSASIKAVLLDQTVLAGVGNIYATEALFFARIDPRREARSLGARELRALARGIQRVFAATLASNDAALVYVNEAGGENPFTIYGREGTACPRCKRPLSKIVLAGRGTVFCERCQT